LPPPTPELDFANHDRRTATRTSSPSARAKVSCVTRRLSDLNRYEWAGLVVACFLLGCGDTTEEHSTPQADGGTCESACYSGSTSTRGVGACRDGIRDCEVPNVCAGEVVPSDEDCSTPFDDDCDGEINEADAGCSCQAGATEECYSGSASTKGVGACVAGTHACDASGRAWGPCAAEVLPTSETCSSPIDDDCDGAVNEEGPDCVCVSGTKQACYSGPAGVIGKGACVEGAQTCNGLGWSSCEGEVVPQSETCTTWFDDDCNEVSECLGDISWLLPLGDAKPQYPIGIADNPLGGTYLLVHSDDHAELWSTDVFAPQPTLSLVTSYPAQVEPSAMGRDEFCTVIAGRYNGTPDFGDGPVAAGSNDLFIVELVPSSPTSVLVRPSATGSVGATVLVDTSTCGLVAGTLDGSVNFGSGVVSSTAPAAFVAKFTSNGTNHWTRLLATESSGSLEVKSVNASTIGGSFSGTVNFGTGTLVSAGGTDAFLVELDTDGTAVSAQRFGGTGDDSITSITRDYGFTIVGNAAGGIDFGQGPLAAGAFVASFDPGYGIWSTSIPGCSAKEVSASWLYPYVLGSCATPSDLGQGVLPAGGFVGAVDEFGKFAWTRPIPSNTDHVMVWGSPTYWPRLAGSFTGKLDWMGHSFTSAGTGDVFLAELSLSSSVP
jgi:hypothetical protein